MDENRNKFSRSVNSTLLFSLFSHFYLTLSFGHLRVENTLSEPPHKVIEYPWSRRMVCEYSSRELIADMRFQEVSGLFKNLSGMSSISFESIIRLLTSNHETDAQMRQVLPVQHLLAHSHSSLIRLEHTSLSHSA